MQCEMCGKECDAKKAIVEGVEMNLCPDCARFGKVIVSRKTSQGKGAVSAGKRSFPERENIVQELALDYPKQVRTARERLGLTQKEFARMMAQKESVIHKIESGKLEPSISLARKLESNLKIRLVFEQVEEKTRPQQEKKTLGQFTLGDMIKVRRRK